MTTVSLNSYGYRGGDYGSYMFGPRFSGLTQKALTTAETISLGAAALVD